MTPFLKIMACQVYRAEFEAVLHEEGWHDVRLGFYPQACSHPNFRPQALARVTTPDTEEEEIALMGGCFMGGPRAATQEGLHERTQTLEHCLYLLVNRTLVDHLVAQGDYLVTPGWLAEWRMHFSAWGFDQTGARQFFQEFVRRLVLLDTGVDPQSADRLAELGTYLGLPVDTLPVGLSFLRQRLADQVSEWRARHVQAENQIAISKMRRDSADYAMTMDLLTNLTRAMNENQAIVEIADLFTMLFSSGRVRFFSVLDDRIQPMSEEDMAPADFSAIQDWLVSSPEEYAWMADHVGFMLRLAYKKQVMGVLLVDQISLGQYHQQYLNLALTIAPLCGLAIANARIYSRLQQAESTARFQKEIADTMRQILAEMVAERNPEKQMHVLLVLLQRVLTFSSAAIYTLEKENLMVRAQIDLNATDQPESYALVADGKADWFLRLPCVIDDIQTEPAMSHLALARNIHGGLCVPLLLRGEAMGCLIINSQKKDAFGENEMRLAQMLADEAAVAIENTRLFQEIRALAITDGLTGLYNRRHFFELAIPEFQRSQRYRRPLSLVMLDIDHFKRVNDTYGHSAGDEALRRLAEILRSRLRSADVTARYGGEEFVLLLPETNLLSACAFSERLRKMIAEIEIHFQHHRFHISASLGVATMDETCIRLEELLYRADEALYQAKAAGRNTVANWQESAIDAEDSKRG